MFSFSKISLRSQVCFAKSLKTIVLKRLKNGLWHSREMAYLSMNAIKFDRFRTQRIRISLKWVNRINTMNVVILLWDVFSPSSTNLVIFSNLAVERCEKLGMRKLRIPISESEDCPHSHVLVSPDFTLNTDKLAILVFCLLNGLTVGSICRQSRDVVESKYGWWKRSCIPFSPF
jgi:hypothetical protein